MSRSAAVLLAAVLAGCSGPGSYGLDEQSGRIFAMNSSGRVTRWYEPGTAEYEQIADRFWPRRSGAPAAAYRGGDDRRERLAALMRGLDKEQWHILLDLELWTGKDREDLARLEDIEKMAAAVKGLPFLEYLEMKEQTPFRRELMARLLKGERSK